jgi:glycosyltransferase involved in cell wall biosynthesis
MRVLLINDYEYAGGAETMVRLTASGLRERGHDVETLFGAERPGGRRAPWSYIDSRAGRRAVVQALREFAPDVVHLHNFYHELSPGILRPLDVWKKGAPASSVRRILMTAHDYHLLAPNPGLREYAGGTLRRLEPEAFRARSALRRHRWDASRLRSRLRVAQYAWNYRLHDRAAVIDRVLCPSRFLADALGVIGLPTGLLPNPAPGVRATPPRPAWPLTFVFAGRLAPEKGVRELLEAWPADGPRLEIVGDGPERTACAAVVGRRGLDVVFHGAQSRDETLAHFARAHVAVLPSLWVENAPMVLFEALAHSAWLLVSDFGGMQEVVREAGVGSTFDPEVPATLAAAIEDIAARHAAGTLNRFDVRTYLDDRSEATYFDRLLAYYHGDAGPDAAA